MNYSVLVYDDDPFLAEGWCNKIKEIVPKEYKLLSAHSKEQVCNMAQEILQRRAAVRNEEPQTLGKCFFDKVDILIIDYDLLHIGEDNTQYTGESIARLARMFSSCGIIVVINQFPGVHFDLTLRGHIASHADINIDGDLLSTSGLWQRPPWGGGFRPWAWQTLSQAVETQNTRERVVSDTLDQPIVEVLGMQHEDASRLSDTAFAFIAPEAKDFPSLQRITFRKFLSEALSSRDSQSLVKRDAEAARFAAARIGKWLEREVLGPQDVLIDIPHLLQRFPFLLGEKVTELDAWNETIHNVGPLRKIIDQNYWFEPENFLSRPAVWGQRLEADDEINEIRSAFDFTSVPNFVFLEDRSIFVKFSEATEFRAGFHNRFDRRFVMPVEDFRYAPQRRFAFGG